MNKFPSIEQFRHVIRAVRSKHDFQGKDADGNAIYEHKSNYPTLAFRGTVKLHGTNAGIVRYADGRTEFQSRERVLTADADNCGFHEAMSGLNLESLFNGFEFQDRLAVFGEWCGGNIQKGVAINGLPKMFVIFAVRVDGEWVELPPTLHHNDLGIYNILQFPTHIVEIDFNTPEAIQNHIIDLTVAVEEKCPVGEFFGQDGVGEGLVFTCLTDLSLMFKSKGEKHSATKVRKLNPVNTELMANIQEFVDSTVTESRLEQGLSYFRENGIEVEPKNTGQFLGWVVRDVLKEESDTLVASGLEEKAVKNAIVTKARMWFMGAVVRI